MALQKNLSFVLFGEDRSASSTMTKTQEVAEKATGKIGGAFASLGSKLGGEFGEILSMAGEGMATVGERSGKLSATLGIGGGVVTGLGVAMQTMGSANKQATDQLSQALKTAGSSYEEHRGQIEKVIAAQQDLGHSDDDTQTALRKMTTAFGDPNKAIKDMALVSDLAAAKHISLADAADLVVKVTSGKGAKTLAAYGVVMGTGKDKTVEAQKALEQLAGKVSGQASASVDNFSGKVNAIKTKMGDWAADMANQIGPALTAIGPIMMGAAAAMEIFKAISGAVKAAQLAQTAATEAGTVAQTGFNLAMLANPIVLIIVLIVALVAGLIWFFTQTKLGQEIWSNFMSFLTDAWNNIVTVAGVVWNAIVGFVTDAVKNVLAWVSANWGLLLSFLIGPLGLVIQWIVENWSGIVKFFSSVWSNIIGFFKSAGATISGIWSGIWSTLGNIVSGAFNVVVGFVKGYFNTIIRLVNGVIDGINGMTGIAATVGIKIGKIPHIPKLALGAIVNSPTVAMIGESGPEAVVPLNAGGNFGVGGGGGLTVQVTVQAGAVGNEQFLAKTVTDAIINAIRSGGVNRQELRTALGV
ncbi:MAG: hypothetical protein JWP32_2902 [Schumannella sp.]|nr:hypothetical protein [Schumannella sp.]